MLPRFFVPEAGRVAPAVLPEDEAAHLTRVLRLTTGDRIRVFDGRGHEWIAVVVDAGQRRVELRLEEAMAPVPEPAVAIALAVALLKGEKMDAVVRDAVMLGVTAIRPLVTTRTERFAAAGRDKAGRWRRIAVSSAKQCGRAVVPAILDLSRLTDLLAQPAPGVRLLLVEPQAAGGRGRPLREVPRTDAAELVVGPEGGWTEGELTQAAETGARLVTLGARTLRADAAPLVALAALRALWDDL